LVFILILMLAGAIYESAAEAHDVRAYPPPGILVDVGGYRLHINCTGAGSPTVVIDTGLGDWSLSWASWVQPEVAKTTRVCSYDRAGMGYSEPGPLPRDAAQFARELHTLLQKADIQGPYVLVGHSLGGLPTRVFTHEYPTEVAGVVLIESMNPGQSKDFPADVESQSTAHSTVLSMMPLTARLGIVRLFAGQFGFELALSPETAKAYTAFSVTPRFFQTSLDEYAGLPRSLAQAAAVKTFGDLPLIVVTRGRDLYPDWEAWQAELLDLSSNSRQLIAEKSGHKIEVEQPQAAVEAIVQMVELVRQAAEK